MERSGPGWLLRCVLCFSCVFSSCFCVCILVPHYLSVPFFLLITITSGALEPTGGSWAGLSLVLQHLTWRDRYSESGKNRACRYTREIERNSACHITCSLGVRSATFLIPPTHFTHCTHIITYTPSHALHTLHNFRWLRRVPAGCPARGGLRRICLSSRHLGDLRWAELATVKLEQHLWRPRLDGCVMLTVLCLCDRCFLCLCVVSCTPPSLASSLSYIASLGSFCRY